VTGKINERGAINYYVMVDVDGVKKNLYVLGCGKKLD